MIFLLLFQVFDINFDENYVNLQSTTWKSNLLMVWLKHCYCFVTELLVEITAKFWTFRNITTTEFSTNFSLNLIVLTLCEINTSTIVTVFWKHFIISPFNKECANSKGAVHDQTQVHKVIISRNNNMLIHFLEIAITENVVSESFSFQEIPFFSVKQKTYVFSQTWDVPNEWINIFHKLS